MSQEFDGPEYQALRRGFPYPVIEVNGARALEEWTRLKRDAHTTPIIIGGEEDFFRVAEACVGYLGDPNPVQSVAAILAAARDLKHPDGWNEYLAREEAAYADLPLPQVIGPDGRVLTPAEARDFFGDERTDAELVGEWPDDVEEGVGLTVATDILSGAPYAKVFIAILPTADSTEAPAYLRWGGWNSCPAPEYEVAAFRSWRDRFGADIVGMSGDVLNFKVAHRPQTRDDALALAREQYAFCADIVDQGVGSLSPLAALLMASDWWYFWWD